MYHRIGREEEAWKKQPNPEELALKVDAIGINCVLEILGSGK